MISIIILCKNGAKTIRCLFNKLSQQNLKENLEVVVIDSCSTDESLNICSEYPVNIKSISPETFNYGLTKNNSLQFCKGEFIVFLSQDAVPADKFWLKHLIEPLTIDSSIAGAYSRQLPTVEADIYEQFYLTTTFPITAFVIDSNTPNWHHFSNASSVVRRDILEKTPFEKLPFAEDRIWANQVIKDGYKIAYSAKSKVYHAHQHNLKEHFQRAKNNAITKRLTTGFKANPFRLISKFFTPSGVKNMLSNYATELDHLGLTVASDQNDVLSEFYKISLSRYLGEIWGSRIAYKKYIMDYSAET